MAHTVNHDLNIIITKRKDSDGNTVTLVKTEGTATDGAAAPGLQNVNLTAELADDVSALITSAETALAAKLTV